MRKFVCTLYLPLILIANTAFASEVGKLQIHETPLDAVDIAVEDVTGEPHVFGPSETALRVVNLWALWCVSCRKEMPTLDALSEEFSPEELTISAVAIGRNDPEKVDKFLGEIGVSHLDILYDKRQKYAGAVGAFAIPMTLFLNSSGEEVARIIGEADYLDPELQAAIADLIETPKS